jgi:glycosyltransferase involved in cell wall biosynthesis
LGIQYQCEFHASNEEEKFYIQKIFGNQVKIFIAPNFPRQIPQQSTPEKKAGHLQLISIALISPMKNHFLVLEALSKCSSHIEYNIYGPIKDPGYWNMCVELIKKMPSNISVNYHADIPPFEVETALSKNQVFILPSKSENFGHAFYEALSAGKPLITSHNTPWNHLKESGAGINVDIKNPRELIDAIEFFAKMGADEFENYVNNAKEYCRKAISIEDIRQQHKQMFIF